MSDASAKPQAKKPKAKTKKGKGALIAIIVILLIVGGAATVLALNIGGFRENVVMPYLRNAPLVGQFFPAAVEEDIIDEMTEEELRIEIMILRVENEGLQRQLNEARNEIRELYDHILDLNRYRNVFIQARETQAAYEQIIVHGAPSEFVQMFPHLSDEHLVRLFIEAWQLNEFHEETMALVRTYNNMEASNVGEIIIGLLPTQQELMLRVLREMSPARRGEIFDTMDSNIVTTISVLMSVDPPVFQPLIPPLLPEIPIFIPPAAPVVIPDEEESEVVDETEETPETEPEEDEQL